MSEPTPGSQPVEDWKTALTKYSAWTLLVFYLLGALPGVRSPIDRVLDTINNAVAAHNDSSSRELQALRAILGETLTVTKKICDRLPPSNRAPDCR